MLVSPARLSSCPRAALLTCLAFTAALFFLLTQSDTPVLGNLKYDKHKAASKAFTSQIVSFWQELARSLEDARPSCPPITDPTEPMPADDREWEPLKQKQRPERLNLALETQTELMQTHRRMRVAAKRLAPTLPTGQGVGIVTTGSVEQFPVLLVSLRMLRRTGCSLPVQVFVGDFEEYKEVRSTCEGVLRTLNARCYIVSDIYSKAAAFAPSHYQFKVLAMLFSSFRHILFLDADSMPAQDPTPLLNSPPYTTHGLVTWPDFHANTASASFYHIAGIPVPPISRGSESGQLLLNKDVHRESLLMMVYYNYYGPDYYYPLQSQGGPGQGDKETFVAAALAVSAPYYAVKTPVRALGFHRGNQFIFAGAAQADPTQDFRYDPPAPSRILPNYQWGKTDKVGAEKFESAKARAFFVHTVSDHSKINPTKVLRIGGKAWEADGKQHRIWGEEKSLQDVFGYDVEKRMWQCVGIEACRVDKELCGDVKSYYETVFRAKLPS
ncbi:glycosyltransferase family 71 protein [Plenodomus tracheiphilus IPT5]|uniref:Glycosyltransferase family 71 protein n=1 Tax=Plenodomus tracheiphilus IPT5 TaxID=1408161 RepID=A0A6A7AMY5_9PLEO|nr:glycosyltransferase family 71 protein [Plenodomus tracheiphilus IPT5]